MLGMKNKKKTAMNGIGISVLLTLLMALSPMTGIVGNPLNDTVQAVEMNDAAEDDVFALPEKLEPVDYDYAAESELVGARDATSKTFVNDDGTFTLLSSTDPIHYQAKDGSWQDIDLNLKVTSTGWEVAENTFTTAFAAEVANGIVVQPNQWVDPIVSGLNPMLITMDEAGVSPMPFEAPASIDAVSVGGNTIRYPLAEGFSLDYSVTSTQVKQNLIIRDRPVLDESAAWFGFTEAMRLPAGYALYSGETQVGMDVVQTDRPLSVRNIETGELYVEIPAPVIVEAGDQAPYTGTFFVMAQGPVVFLTTAVETSWLLADERVYPLALDPTLSVTASGGGYCYIYYSYCYVSTYRDSYHSSYGGRSSSTYRPYYYYVPWNKYTFSSSNALPTGASVDKIESKEYHSYHYSYLSTSMVYWKTSVLEDCGSTRPATSATGSAPTTGNYYYNTYSGYTMSSPSCSGAISSSYLPSSSQYGTTAAKSIINAAIFSPAVSKNLYSTGWQTTELCSGTGTNCSTSSMGSYIWSAVNNSGTVGTSKVFDASNIGTTGTNSGTTQYAYTYAYSSGSTQSYLAITYSGGTDSDAPTADFGEYSDLTTYVEGARTFFISLSDMSGIDTTSGNQPTLYYAINNGTYSSVSATTIGTCSSSSNSCQFKAKTSDLSEGDYVTYYWEYQDLNQGSNGANVGYTPALTGTQTTPTPYWFFIDSVDNAGSAKKMVQLTTDVHAGSYYTPYGFMDRQMTYFDSNDEYYFEFDTSNCGTGSSSCWYTGSSSSDYFYNNWIVEWQTNANPATSSYNTGGTSGGKKYLDANNGGYLSISADDGPGMNLIFLWDGNTYGMVGIGDEPDIGEKLGTGTSATYAAAYGYTTSYRYQVGDITANFAGYTYNSTYSSTGFNWVCTGSNGWTHFLRSTSTSPSCSSGYYYIYSTSYKWNGFALGSGYYGRMASSGDVTYAVTKVAPEPDTYSPIITHTALADSYAKTRTITASIGDFGYPPAGLNVSTSAGTGPTVYYSVNNGTTSSLAMSPVGSTRASCAESTCDWSADIEDLETGDYVTYSIQAWDVSEDVANPNGVNTSDASFSVGDPNKMMIFEWHDMGYTSTYLCTYQVVFYDVTNEFEFKYDTGCQVYYDYSATGYQNQNRSWGETLQKGTGYVAGANVFSNNYRMHTSATSYGHENFDLGLSEITNYDTALSGSSSGTPYGYYCAYYYYWNTYKSGCNANIDMPDDFDFEYFGVLYEGTDSNDRINLGRQGNMHFISSGSTALVQSVDTWSSNMPDLPYSGSTYSRAGLIAPWWGYYTSYYCYDNTNYDCSIRYRTMPYNGKGTDVDSDITTDTTWDIVDSPVRINPSGDYLSISADLTIKPGVVVQVANGKGISFDGSCDQMTLEGNSTDHIRFEGQDGATWTGMAFTAACSTGTDDRHVFSYVDFANTTDAAIAAGSRHGSSPSTNANVGNFTMDHVTFEDVGSAFQHGSGQGTVLEMNDFSVDGASGSCFDLAEDSVVTLFEGSLKDCNTAGGGTDGAIVSVQNSAGGGLLHVENVTVTNAYGHFIAVDLEDLHLSNVTVTNTGTTGYAGEAIDHTPWRNGGQTGSSVYMFNVTVPDYSSGSYFDVIESIHMEDVDFGSNDITFRPGGTGVSTVGPAGDNAVMMNVEAGDLDINRVHFGTFSDITAGDVDIEGTTSYTDAVVWQNLDVGYLEVRGGGWTIYLENADISHLYSFTTSAANTIVMEGGSSISHTDSNEDAVYAYNTHITLAAVAIDSSNIDGSTNYVAAATSGGEIVMIETTYDDGNGALDCADTNGAAQATAGVDNCAVSVSSSSKVWYGGLATVKLYRESNIGGTITKVYKSGHSVRTAVVDASGTSLFDVGTVQTNSNGEASAWIISGNSDGDTYDDHTIYGWGAAGQNETDTSSAWYPSGGFGWGDTIELLLQPAPINFDQPNMDCTWMSNNVTFIGAQSSAGVYVFDSFPMTLSADLDIDGCTLVLMGSVLTVDASATNSPVLTVSNGGTLLLNVSTDTGTKGTLKAQNSNYGVRMNFAGGTLAVAGGVVKDLHQDSSTMSALYVADGALSLTQDGTIYGATTSSDDMATVKVNGGSLTISDSSIINTGATGTALWVESAGASIDNIVVKNAAVGIMSKNAAPQVDGFTSTGNTVGVDLEGGMSLPTIYRSTSLSGQTTGWKTYAIDLSTFLGSGDYLQVGANSIYGGGNAHPTYNYATSKYYYITDRLAIQLTDDNGNSWNITKGDTGYYPYSANDPDEGSTTGSAADNGNNVGTYQGGVGGAPQYDCNLYGYTYGPNYTPYGANSGYMYYFYYYGGYGGGSIPSFPGYYQPPYDFGFRWENIPGVSPTGTYAYYPYHYWGYYSPSSMFSGVYAPPEGFNGLFGYYNVCLDYAYTYYMSSGQGARITWPIIDISATNITKATLYIDVLHKGADNYQDRYEFVARTSNDPSDMGTYLRESGTPLFKDGTITGADVGVEIGGDFAAGHFQNVDVSSPNDAGLSVVGSTMASADTFNVSGGDYGVLVGSGASGQMDMDNMDLDSQTVAGAYYLKDFGGDFTGTVTNSAGSAFKFGPSTSKDLAYDSVTFENNAIGFDLAGSGDFTFVDSTFDNTDHDFSISGSSTVDYIEGTVDLTTVEVTGSGAFNRMREVDITMTADENDGNGAQGVSGVNVRLMTTTGDTASSGTTDANGVAEAMTFTTDTVDAQGTHDILSLGYVVTSVAEVDYYWTDSSDNNADFRYVSEAVTLLDASGNTAEVELVDQFTRRVCYAYTSTSYIMVSNCYNSWSSTGSSRTFSNGLVEHGYYYGSIDGSDFTGETVMIDAPFLYLDADTHEWNDATFYVTASYDYYGYNLMYPYYYGEVNMEFHNSSITGMAANTDGVPQGVQFGYQYYSMNLDANGSSFNGIASIIGGMGYGYYPDYELDHFYLRNSTITHYKGYTPLNNAIQVSDICIQMYGGEGDVIENNTFTNCGVGMIMQRSPYYYSHNTNEYGADNLTIQNNLFVDGGEINDIWFYTGAYSDGGLVTGNTFNNSMGSNVVAAYDSTTTGLTVSDNVMRGFEDTGVFIRGVEGFLVDGNELFGPGEGSVAIYTDGGSGDITDNTIVDADDGILMTGATQPIGSTTSLCQISGNYGYSDSCSFSFAGNGSTLIIDIATDSWGYEISLVITKPDGTTDSWSTYTFASNTAYKPLKSYTAAGTYQIDVSDSYGDGGITLDAYYTTAATGVSGPVISGNDISISAGREVSSTYGITLEDCSGTSINMMSNSISLPTNAIVLDGCDASDDGSTLIGGSQAGSIGVVHENGDSLTLSGTDISGFEVGVSADGGLLVLNDNASIAADTSSVTTAAGSSNDAYGVYAYDSSVMVNYASVDGGASGVGLHLEDSGAADLMHLDLSGFSGLEVYNTQFRYNMGTADAEDAIYVSDSVGLVENLTWGPNVNTQIELAIGASVTSIGQDLTPSMLVLAAGTMIEEANLLDITTSHLGADTTREVGVSIVSTDGLRAAYISPDFQPDVMTVDGDNADWIGSELNPADDVMPGELTSGFYVTYTENDDLYIGLDNVDLSTSDLLIYLDVTGGGSYTGYDYGAAGAHDLPFEADFLFWAESGSSSDLYAYGFLGWGVTSLSSASVDSDFSGDFAEIMIPFSRMGGMPAQARIIAIVQSDSSADVSEVYPDQTIDSSSSTQDFSEYYTVVMGGSSLEDGILNDEVLTYRSFLGSNVPTAAKEYDVMVKHVNNDCSTDWATENDVNMSDNVALTMDIERACPTIGSALANITVDEDSTTYEVSLTSYASDVQDDAGDLTWSVEEGDTTVVYSNTPLPADGLVTWSLNGHDLSITPVPNQFGVVQFNFTVTDSNGLEDDRIVFFIIENVNDAPEICQRDTSGACVTTVRLFGDATHVNHIPEDSLVGGQSVSVILSDVANQGTNALNLIKDQPNENDPFRQVYTWSVSVDETCPLFSASMVDDTVLTITGKSGMDFEAGGSCDMTLSLSDDGAENQDAVDDVIEIFVVPVNDAPTIDDWNLQTGDTITWASNDSSLIYGEWTIKVMEDTEDTDELTFDLSALKADVDHDGDALFWQLLPKLDDNGRAYCSYTNYFSFSFSGDELVLDLVKDATTNAPINQIDYLYDGGVHQVNPAGKGFCEMELYLVDSAVAPTGFAYDLNDNGYIQQTSLKRDVKIIVQNVAEQVPDYYFESASGFDFNGISNVMDGTWVPVSVTVKAGGDEGPYNHDQMLRITFQSDGHSEVERDAVYIPAPAYGTSVVVTEDIYIKQTTNIMWVEMDVLTCVDETCDMTKSISDRFIADDPASHGIVTLPNNIDYWTEPGYYGSENGVDSIRRPVLEDKDWCNNVMYNTKIGNIDVCDQADYGRGTFTVTDQDMPDVVRTIGASGVPSFAPSLVAVALAGVVVGLLSIAGRRDDDEEELVEVRMRDDEQAVSPVIATILMVAITVVLSGVIYVWASSLAETDVKGVPRITFDMEEVNIFDSETGHWRISIEQAEVRLATQAVEVKVFADQFEGGMESYRLADSSDVYGFTPSNSPSVVTFADIVDIQGEEKVSTFFVGDTIYVRSHTSDGTPLTGISIQISYSPEVGQGALLRSWSNLESVA